MDNDEVSLKLDDLVRYLPAPLRDKVRAVVAGRSAYRPAAFRERGGRCLTPACSGRRFAPPLMPKPVGTAERNMSKRVKRL